MFIICVKLVLIVIIYILIIFEIYVYFFYGWYYINNNNVYISKMGFVSVGRYFFLEIYEV